MGSGLDDTISAGSGGLGASGELIGGRYRILSLLGAGGMGSVYRVRDTELDEVVALKMLHRHVVDAPGALARFRQEVKLARRVTHGNVARTFDIGEHAGEKYLTMEYVDGESLSAPLRRRGALPIGEAISIARAVCAGLSAAHAAGVVHRDLKPDNILFAKNGRVLVTDFGIARGLSADGSSQTIGNTVGTPAYMAPEQVEARPDVDGRADVYALGAVLFEMLTGARAWPGDGAMAVAAARLHQAPPDPLARRPDLPEGLARAVVRCLQRAREDRFATADELMRSLEGFAAAAPTPAPRADLSTPSLSRPIADLSMAVLPLRNLGAADEAYLADGLTEDLIDALSMTQGVKVRARGAVMPFKGQELDPREIGHRLDVRVVVEGSVRKLGEQVRVTVRLLNVDDGFQLWTRRFDRTLGELLTVNEEAARAIAEALSAKSPTPARPAQAADSFAVELYLRARQLSESEAFTQPESISLLEQALERAPNDPTILSAYTAALSRVPPGSGPLFAKSAQLARATAERAVEVAPELGEPWLALATAMAKEGDTIGVMTSLRRALRNAPSLASAEEMVGAILIDVGAVEEGIERLRRARWMNPRLFYPEANLVRAYDLSGRFAESEVLLSEARDQRHEDLRWLTRYRHHLWAGKRPELGPPPSTLPAYPLRLATLLHQAVNAAPDDVQWSADLRTLLGSGALRTPGRRFPCQLLAELHAYKGDDEAALEWIADANVSALSDLMWMDRLPLFANLRKDPRFTVIRDQVADRAAKILAAWR